MADPDHIMTFKQSFSSPEMSDENINMINNFAGLNQSLIGMGMGSYPHDMMNIFTHDHKLPSDQLFIHDDDDQYHDHRKRKSMEMIVSVENSPANSSPQASHNATTRSKKSGGKGKKVKDNEREVVHVRARRGQATDSHSLAERVRRGRINERLRCLQDIVPGCHKTMGMAVMLDEIINYVQSLQNQVEFLSMKLTAASTFNDFNFDTTDAIETMQRAKAFEALTIQNIASPGLHSSQFAQLDLKFGYYSQLPRNI